MSTAPRLERVPWPTPRRHVTIPAGEDKIVFEDHMTGEFVGFIDRISVSRGDNELGCDNTWVDWKVDGVLIERIKREISLNLPDKFDPPHVVRKKTVFTAHNGDSSDHEFEVVVQGQLCRPRPRPRLF